MPAGCRVFFRALHLYGSQRSAYSSARYWKHREYQASLGCAVVLAVLVAKLMLAR